MFVTKSQDSGVNGAQETIRLRGCDITEQLSLTHFADAGEASSIAAEVEGRKHLGPCTSQSLGCIFQVRSPQATRAATKISGSARPCPAKSARSRSAEIRVRTPGGAWAIHRDSSSATTVNNHLSTSPGGRAMRRRKGPYLWLFSAQLTGFGAVLEHLQLPGGSLLSHTSGERGNGHSRGISNSGPRTFTENGSKATHHRQDVADLCVDPQRCKCNLVPWRAWKDLLPRVSLTRHHDGASWVNRAMPAHGKELHSPYSVAPACRAWIVFDQGNCAIPRYNTKAKNNPSLSRSQIVQGCTPPLTTRSEVFPKAECPMKASEHEGATRAAMDKPEMGSSVQVRRT
ncbi:hypothetical protein CLAIMM_06373 isoform 1 [Cladophialophora immunda]|nr:hypothetical protein CLAIMM_06373 isoform 1 [Cladophialophora immunda]